MDDYLGSPSNPLRMKVPFFLLFSFNKETQIKRAKGHDWDLNPQPYLKVVEAYLEVGG